MLKQQLSEARGTVAQAQAQCSAMHEALERHAASSAQLRTALAALHDAEASAGPDEELAAMKAQVAATERKEGELCETIAANSKVSQH